MNTDFFDSLAAKVPLRRSEATAETSIAVAYKDHSAGEHCAGVRIEGPLAMALKCAERLVNQHTAQ